MAELDRILTEARETQLQMQAAATTAGESTAREIVSLRTRLAALIAEMIGSIKADSRLRAKPDVGRRLEAKFFEMRQALAQHQVKWRSADIEENPADYRRSTEELDKRIDGFFTWARNTLAGL